VAVHRLEQREELQAHLGIIFKVPDNHLGRRGQRANKENKNLCFSKSTKHVIL
jgi:hypothetical protein